MAAVVVAGLAKRKIVIPEKTQSCIDGRSTTLAWVNHKGSLPPPLYVHPLLRAKLAVLLVPKLEL